MSQLPPPNFVNFPVNFYNNGFPAWPVQGASPSIFAMPPIPHLSLPPRFPIPYPSSISSQLRLPSWPNMNHTANHVAMPSLNPSYSPSQRRPQDTNFQVWVIGNTLSWMPKIFLVVWIEFELLSTDSKFAEEFKVESQNTQLFLIPVIIITKISLMSPIVINVPTRASLAVETKGLLFLWLAYLNKKTITIFVIQFTCKTIMP